MTPFTFSIGSDDDRRRPSSVTETLPTSWWGRRPLLGLRDAMGTGRAALVAAAVAALMAAHLFSATDGHVALTFPSARRFDLDFLDNFRTKAPCGMPKGKIARRPRRRRSRSARLQEP